MPEFQSQYAHVNGIRLHYVSVGDGKLVMFVHGFPEFWSEWETQLIEFGKDYQAVALDMRGYNLSSKPASRISSRICVLWPNILAMINLSW
jgi:pimeloyl-ACP methyl ester carboxylesterase